MICLLAMAWLLSSIQIKVLFTTGSQLSAGVIARACVSLAGPYIVRNDVSRATFTHLSTPSVGLIFGSELNQCGLVICNNIQHTVRTINGVDVSNAACFLSVISKKGAATGVFPWQDHDVHGRLPFLLSFPVSTPSTLLNRKLPMSDFAILTTSLSVKKNVAFFV